MRQKKTAKLINSVIILKIINFKVKKTITYQPKLSKRFNITNANIGGH